MLIYRSKRKYRLKCKRKPRPKLRLRRSKLRKVVIR